MKCAGDRLVDERGEQVQVSTRRTPHTEAEMEYEDAGTMLVPGQDPELMIGYVCPTCGRKAFGSRPRAYLVDPADSDWNALMVKFDRTLERLRPDLDFTFSSLVAEIMVEGYTKPAACGAIVEALGDMLDEGRSA